MEESDADHDELRGVLNSGHTPTTAFVIRTVGEDYEPKRVSTWCPKAVAIIGQLPPTLADRSIPIGMRRKAPAEQVDRWRADRADELTDQRRQVKRWVADHLADLKAADPDIPETLHDRAADNWRSLLAIADLAGGDWPERARASIAEIETMDDEDDASILLLRDLRKVAATRGGEYAGPCPWCGGRDRFRVWPEADKPGYWCRQCGKHGDAIQYLRDRYGLSYRDACQRLRLPTRDRTPWPVSPPVAPKTPSATWQARALEIIEASERRLWQHVGERALAYLRHRGFTEATIKQARLGYHPCEVRDAPERWGLPADHQPVWRPRGIVIPVRQGNHVWMLWIRRPAGEPKYVAVAGSRHADCSIEAVRLGHPGMLVEGILDALAVQQEAGDLVTPIAVGTRHGTPHTIGRLALAKPLILALDADEAGDAAAAWWQRIFPQAKRWRPTQDDPAAMLQSGQDVRGWVIRGLPSCDVGTERGELAPGARGE